jgi:N-glycosidase YbiA
MRSAFLILSSTKLFTRTHTSSRRHPLSIYCLLIARAFRPMSIETNHPCPVCSQSVLHIERYPRSVCGDCYDRACNAKGQKLSFFNTCISGGFEAVVDENQEKHLGHVCYIDGVECRADEGRFGGIVIEAKIITINFYSLNKPYGCFSNFARYAINMKGIIWPTSEHYFQGQKFLGTLDEEELRGAVTPMIAAQMGRERDRPLRHDWEEVKDSIMRDALYAKFSQHSNLKEKLLGTKNATLVEHTANDNYWGDGGDGTGKNMLGILLMEIREVIRREDSEK